MSRYRGAKQPRRYGLFGVISLLSLGVLLSVERWPFHEEPPDHYDRLSVSARLVCLAVRQAYAIALNERFPTALTHHRAPPLLFGRRPPQSNCLPCAVPDPDDGSRLDIHDDKGGISRMAPHELAPMLHSLPPILHMRHECQRKVTVKVHGVFPSDRRNPASSRGIQFH